MTSGMKIIFVALFAIVLALGGALIYSELKIDDYDENITDSYDEVSNELRKFRSYGEFKNFIEENSGAQGGIGGFRDFGLAESVQSAPSIASADSKDTASSYSETNVQVEGVDEPDIVKNDGKYIYTLSGNTVFIVDAYPASGMRILSNISLNDAGFRNIFVNNNRLIIFSDEYITGDSSSCPSISEEGYKLGIPCFIRGEPRTSVYI